jgi:hypothetical protein
MTIERQIELLLNGGDDAVDYELGREAAKEDTATGEPNLARQCKVLSAVMGAAWTRGYTEYYNAWEVLNRA